jgi:thiazole synthase
MPTITINAEPRTIPYPFTVADLLCFLGKDAKKLAVEVNRTVVTRADQSEYRLKEGDAVEIVTLVGGGSGERGGVSPPSQHETAQDATDPCLLGGLTPPRSPLKVGGFTFRSRLFTGTGKYTSYELMQQCMQASGCEVTTVAVRRERLIDKEGKSLLDFLDLKKLTILPNTAGCFSADDAIRHARLARELLANLENSGANWVKLECLADKKTLLPDPVDTLKATEQLVKEGFTVLVYTSDDPVQAKRLKAAGAASVMPAGSPIGSGQGILNPSK